MNLERQCPIGWRMRGMDVQEGSLQQCLLKDQGGLLITSFAISDIIGAIAIFSMKNKS